MGIFFVFEYWLLILIIRLSDFADVVMCGIDPHITTFRGHQYSWHGQCDVVMMRSPSLNIELHARTTRKDTRKISYSYISAVALKINNDVIEAGSDGSLMVNGIISLENETSTIIGGATTISKSFNGKKKKIVVYDLKNILGDMDKTMQIRVNQKTAMVNIEVSNSFPDSVGLLGSPSVDALFARDQKTNLHGDWNALAEEWQVRDSELSLFKDKERFPQHPIGCVYEVPGQTKSNLRRRLLEDSGVTLEMANKACAHAVGRNKEFCVDDVMATGDLDIAEDALYMN